MSPTTTFACTPVIIALPAGCGDLQNAEDIPALIPSMGQNVLVNLLTPVLVAAGLFLA